MPGEADEHDVILFDGHCNLCSGLVRFVIARDPRRRFRFAALQSDAGRKIMVAHGRDAGDRDSVLLLQYGRLYSRSAAALRIARGLKGAWPLLAAFLVLPAPLRDIVYRWIARNRYRWFGKQDACMMPTPELSARFITE